MTASPIVLQALDSLTISYEVMECDPDLADTAAFCEAYGVPLDESANTILVSSRKPPGAHAACVALATHRLDVNGTIRHKLEVRKVSFASAEDTRALTGMEIGGVTVAGLPPAIPLWVDPAVVSARSVVIGAGTRTAKIRLAGADVARLPNAEVVVGLTAG